VSTAPVQTPRGKSNLLWWVLGLGVAVVALLSVSGLLIANLFVKEIRIREKGKQVEIRTPAGGLTVSQGTVGETGLPVYPGSTLVESGKNVGFGTPEEDQKVGLSAVKYHSSDPLEKVAAWYQARLGPEFRREIGDSEGKIRVHGVQTKGIAYVAEDHDLVRVVAISKKASGVEIALLRIGARAAIGQEDKQKGRFTLPPKWEGEPPQNVAGRFCRA